MDKERCVSITHFINPHLFWFMVKVPDSGLRELIRLEQLLMDLYSLELKFNHRPAVNEIIAVDLLSWNKYIRGCVLSVAHLGNDDEYIVWALDYGFPFQTKAQYICELPQQYTKSFENIHCGGLAALLPAEKDFNFTEMSSVLVERSHWQTRACDMLEKVLSDAAAVSFVEFFQTPNGQYWGDLKIVTQEGRVLKASDFLSILDFAIAAGPNFRETCLTFNAVKMRHWLSNSGDHKFGINNRNFGLATHNKVGFREKSLKFNKSPGRSLSSKPILLDTLINTTTNAVRISAKEYCATEEINTGDEKRQVDAAGKKDILPARADDLTNNSTMETAGRQVKPINHKVYLRDLLLKRCKKTKNTPAFTTAAGVFTHQQRYMEIRKKFATKQSGNPKGRLTKSEINLSSNAGIRSQLPRKMSDDNKDTKITATSII